MAYYAYISTGEFINGVMQERSFSVNSFTSLRKPSNLTVARVEGVMVGKNKRGTIYINNLQGRDRRIRYDHDNWFRKAVFAGLLQLGIITQQEFDASKLVSEQRETERKFHEHKREFDRIVKDVGPTIVADWLDELLEPPSSVAVDETSAEVTEA